MSTKEAQLFIHQLLAQIRSEQFVRNNNTDLYDPGKIFAEISRVLVSLIIKDHKGY